MKLIFDQNISHRILKLLTSDFEDSTTVKKESLIDLPDKESGSMQRIMTM